MKNKVLVLIIAILSVVLVASLGSAFNQMGMVWYNALVVPIEWVPDIVFPILWSVVYILFAVYLFLGIKNETLTVKSVILLIINGVLNVLWCWAFFAMQWILIGLVIIILNLVAGWLLWCEIDKNVLTYFMIIYPIWLCIATVLNIAIWIMN